MLELIIFVVDSEQIMDIDENGKLFESMRIILKNLLGLTFLGCHDLNSHQISKCRKAHYPLSLEVQYDLLRAANKQHKCSDQ